MHKYGGLVFWDYASAAPHIEIDVNRPGLAYKDAVFISTHKFIGGPDTPGILIARKDSVFLNPVPDKVGGGSIMYVSRTRHRYLDDIEAKEESGTPQIVGSIRAGLVFKVRNEIGINDIKEREQKLLQKGLQRLKKIPCIRLLGSPYLDRMPLFSFLVLHQESGLYFHHHFINQLLNDLFGIQCRSGCACAGPYAIDLLGMDDQKESMFLNAFDNDVSKIGSLKPGFIRFNLPFYSSDDEIDFVLDAVEFVCVNALYFVPFYELDEKSGSWTNFLLKRSPDPNEITKFKHLKLFNLDERKRNTVSLNDPNLPSQDFTETMEAAERILNAVVKGRLQYPNECFLEASEKSSTQEITWFMTQREALKWLPNTQELLGFGESKDPVFEVRKYPKPSRINPKNGLKNSSQKTGRSKNSDPDSVTEILQERKNQLVNDNRGKNSSYRSTISRNFPSSNFNQVFQPLTSNPNHHLLKLISQEATVDNSALGSHNSNTITININFKSIKDLDGNQGSLLKPKMTADVKKFSKNSYKSVAL